MPDCTSTAVSATSSERESDISTAPTRDAPTRQQLTSNRHIAFAAAAAIGVLATTGLAHAHAVVLQHDAPPLTEYFRLGVEHILTGFDHLVFLLGVVLIATSTRSVLAAVTAFTVAHSLTLALSVLGFVTVSPRLVEPLIALSVAYVGLENFWARDASRRYRITFAFGLVHGFGFAGALAEIGLPSERASAALACFNLGVEAGQLLVLSLLWPLLRWLHRTYARPFMKLASVVSLVIVVLGSAWAIERSLGGEPAVASSPGEPRTETPQESGATPQADNERTPAPQDIHSLYGKAKVSPIAERVCHIVQRYPREQRAECSGEPIGVAFDNECTRMLSAALASGAIKAAAGLDGRCVNAMAARYATCEFMQHEVLPPIAACTELWEGQLAAGATCRSALECQAGLYCHGISPAQPGVCGAAKPSGATCGTGIDPLASYVPNDPAAHPECTTQCVQGRCR